MSGVDPHTGRPHPTLTLLTPHAEGGDCNRCGRNLSTVQAERSPFSVVYCVECDDPENAILYQPHERTFVCRGCWQELSSVLGHHVSYFPERIVPVCDSCHRKIHDDSVDELDHLCPDIGRREAIDRGAKLDMTGEWRDGYVEN